MKKVKEKEAPDLSSLLIFGYACKLFRCLTFATAVLLAMCAELSLNAVDRGQTTVNQNSWNLVHGNQNHHRLIILGYFRDDERALSIEGGNSLIPWMGDPSLRIDRCVKFKV